MAALPVAGSVSDWHIKGEGNANLVYAYVGKDPELVRNKACPCTLTYSCTLPLSAHQSGVQRPAQISRSTCSSVQSFILLGSGWAYWLLQAGSVLRARKPAAAKLHKAEKPDKKDQAGAAPSGMQPLEQELWGPVVGAETLSGPDCEQGICMIM